LANVGTLCMLYAEWLLFFNGLEAGQAYNGDYNYEFVLERLPGSDNKELDEQVDEAMALDITDKDREDFSKVIPPAKKED